MKSKPQFALSSSYESVQCLLKVLGKASMSVLLSSLVRDHTLEQSTPHSNPLLNHRSGVLFFFSHPYSFTNPFSCFPRPFFQTIVIWVRKENAAQKEQKKKPRSFAEGLLGGFSRAQISTGM